MWKEGVISPSYDLFSLPGAWGMAVKSAFWVLEAEILLIIFWRQRISEHLKISRRIALFQLILGTGLILINLTGILSLFITPSELPVREHAGFVLADIPVGLSLLIPSCIFSDGGKLLKEVIEPCS